MQSNQYVFFSANTAFLCVLAAKKTLNTTQGTEYRNMVKEQIAEALGKGVGVSYMVGYGDDYPTRLHDRDR